MRKQGEVSKHTRKYPCIASRHVQNPEQKQNGKGARGRQDRLSGQCGTEQADGGNRGLQQEQPQDPGGNLAGIRDRSQPERGNQQQRNNEAARQQQQQAEIFPEDDLGDTDGRRKQQAERPVPLFIAEQAHAKERGDEYQHQPGHAQHTGHDRLRDPVTLPDRLLFEVGGQHLEQDHGLHKMHHGKEQPGQRRLDQPAEFIQGDYVYQHIRRRLHSPQRRHHPV